MPAGVARSNRTCSPIDQRWMSSFTNFAWERKKSSEPSPRWHGIIPQTLSTCSFHQRNCAGTGRRSFPLQTTDRREEHLGNRRARLACRIVGSLGEYIGLFSPSDFHSNIVRHILVFGEIVSDVPS